MSATECPRCHGEPVQVDRSSVVLSVKKCILMHHRKSTTARQEFRDQENERVKSSTSLAVEFPELRTLTVLLTHFRPERPSRRSSEVKYRLDLRHAKSVLLFSCPNDRCVGGDFDLSASLAEVVASRARRFVGEVTCQGWQSHAMIGTVRCRNLLRYELAATYRGNRYDCKAA